MKANEILEAIKSLSQSQGFYGRLYERLVQDEEALQYLEEQNFTDVVDLVLFLES